MRIRLSVFACLIMIACAFRAAIAGESFADVFTSGEHGLWRVRFQDGTSLSEKDFQTNDVARRSHGIAVKVERMKVDERTADLTITLRNLSQKTATGLDFPARLRFHRSAVKRFSYPGRSNWGFGFAFNWKFFNERHPKNGWWMSYRDSKYPAQFADFARLELTNGASVSVYGLQPRLSCQPWESEKPFCPVTTGVGSDSKDGWYDHAYALYLKPGEEWTSPKVRMRTGGSVQENLMDYSKGNGFRRTLLEKVGDAEKLQRLKCAPLYKLERDAKTAMRILAMLPAPTLYHTTHYLKGGFDKEYPDHFPVNRERFGTDDDFRRVIEFAHGRGHLVCPYTNPTWWCDHPRSPTFVEKGESALLINPDGTKRHETYSKGKVDGWQVTVRHPDVREANRRTLDRFVSEFPVDFVFQDQVGARDWRYDFNPAAKTATDLPESYISMTEEDSRRMPLMTEDGWDRIAENNVALCGCNWWIFPLGMKTFKGEYPADTWEIEPITLYLFHDKCLFYSHDLGAFVKTPALLAWSLAFGYQLSYECMKYEQSETEREWYAWLHLLQKEVVSRVAGQPLMSFRHDRSPLVASGGDLARTTDDGTVVAHYGTVSVAVNLGDREREVAGRRLAPYGWWIESDGLSSGSISGNNPFVEVKGNRYEFRSAKLIQTK